METLSYCQLMQRCGELEAQRDALVVEAAALKTANEVALKILNDEETMITSLWASSVQKVEVETPVTDAAIAALRAEGVEMFAAEMSAEHKKLQSGGYFDRQVLIYAKVSDMAESFARQLRESKGDNHA